MGPPSGPGGAPFEVGSAAYRSEAAATLE